MCGIAGWIDWNGEVEKKQDILYIMIDTLKYRGPDSSGTWITPIAGIGHRRLAVIDPKNGLQPMIGINGIYSFVITYNGELYNTAEVKKELEDLGYEFRTNCDTEVVLTSYIEWGEECVKKFNGIYAFGIWDEKNQNLFLARDRFGVKPLFYTLRENSLIFGSELKTILAHPYVQPVINGEGLAEIFALAPSRTPGNGVFKDVFELKPGYCANYNINGLFINQYWKLQSFPHIDSLDDTVLKVRGLIVDAIKRQLISDVPLCTFLSGGVDSSAITSVAANYYRESNKDELNTYSVDYKDNDLFFKSSDFQPNSDSTWIQKVSKYANTNHHNVILGMNELVESLNDAVIARDLPGMADIDSSLLLFCKEIKKKYTVALSGECADEVFGGYPWFKNDILSITSFPWLRSLDYRLELYSKELVESCKPTEYVKRRYDETLSEVPRLAGESLADSKRRELFYLNFTWFMATLLDRKDRMSMASGLEVRVPFCDHNIVEYVWNIPWEMKYIDGIEKGLMRRALGGILPKDVLYRKKSPYPKTHNPLYTEMVSKHLIEILNDTSSPLLPLINVPCIKGIAEPSSDSFDKPWFGQLMKGPQLMAFLIQVDFWLRHYNVSIV